MLVLAHLHRPVLTQQVHSLGQLAFKGRPSFAKALAKLSRKITQYFLQNETYTLNNKYITYYIYLQCKFRHVYMNFRQNFSQKKNSFAISEKNFSRDYSLHTQRLTQRKPLSWTFCSTLIYIYMFFLYPKTLSFHLSSRLVLPPWTFFASFTSTCWLW